MNSHEPLPLTPWAEYRRGLLAALPLLLGVFPFGVIFATLAIVAGFSPTAIHLMSATVFAGAAQFLAVTLYAANAAPATIILATLIINLRHVLYGVSLGQTYAQTRKWVLPLLAFTTVDEVFVLVQTRLRPPNGQSRRPPMSSPRLHWYALGIGTVLYSGWQTATWLGVAGSNVMPDPRTWGLEFALPAAFIAFLIPQLRRRPVIICALVAGAGAVFLRHLPLQGGFILATLLGVAAGVAADRLGRSRATTDVHRPTDGHIQMGRKS